MRKIKSFFCLLLLAVSSHAATLTCTFGPAPDYQCTSFNLSDITQVNEAITVPGAPFTPYNDNMTTNLHLHPPTYFTSIQQFPKKLFEIFPNLFSFNIQEISMTELATDSIYNCEKLNGLKFMFSNLGNIRAGFASTCSLIQAFSIYNSFILSIDENAFQGMQAVETLMLHNCSLTCISPKLLQPLTKLESIDLSSNKLTAIHSQIFAHFRRLTAMNLGDNLIGYFPNLNLSQTGLDFAANQLSISFQNNPIKAISPLFMTTVFNERLNNTVAFISFYPGNNPQSNETCVDPNFQASLNLPVNLFMFGQTPNWTLQDALYQNSTTCYSSFTAEMESDSLVTCGNVLTTTTSSSTISPVQCATDKICRYYLDWNNQYTCVIDGAEGTVTSISGTHYLSFTDADLTRLYFTNSHLGKVPNVLFQKFPNLKYLHIRNTGLSVINDQTFNECGNLEFLDASDNEIFRVEETALKNCTKLKIIDLTGNEIDHVSVGLYQNDPALQRVHLRRLDDWILA